MAEYNEWQIKNFSCWNNEIHCEYLRIRGIRLYPRGENGTDKHLEVSIEKWPYVSVSELSFIGSDGSLICRISNLYANRAFRGPKFEEVVAGIRGNEPLHKDRLILRWETRQGWRPGRFRTVIDAYSAFFQIKPDMFHMKELDWNDWGKISYINFRLSDENKKIIVSARKTGYEDTKVKLKLESNSEEDILARTSIWMLNGDKIMQKYEDDCILVKDDVQILPYEVPLIEYQGLQTIMRCKIIAGESIENFEYNADFPLSPDIMITCVSRFCEIKYLGNGVVFDATRESSSFPRESQTENAVAALTKDLTCLYQDHDFSDFELRCGTVSFPTHRNILSARSPVLKAMLSGGMREASSGHVDVVEDLDPHTLGRFLAFLYSGTSEKDLEWEGALRLYYAADKYQVPSLKEECAAVLCASVSLENVCDILSLADKHQDDGLRSVTHDFILENFNEVLGSENWEKLIISDPLLVAKTVTDVAKNKYVKKK